MESTAATSPEVTSTIQSSNLRPALLLKLGELTLKGENRPYFEKCLFRNIRRAIDGLDWNSIERADRRMYVYPGRLAAPTEIVSERLRKVFGLSSVAAGVRTRKDWSDIRRAALDVIAKQLGKSDGETVTFKISARRVDKIFPMRSLEMARELGSALLAQFDRLRVDVHRPAIDLCVEIRFDAAWVYPRGFRGAGGLPVGCSGKALALISGGIDSPVSLWFALKRGLSVEAIHFDTPGFTHPGLQGKVKDLCERLAEWGGPSRLHIIDFTPLYQAIWASAPAALRVTLMRRMFIRIAERVAGEVGARALVTGDSLGQVASQTLESMTVIGESTHLPMLRPLIGFDKEEIVERARGLGTFEISSLPYEDCCALFVADHPETRPQLDAVRAAEAGLNVSSAFDVAVQTRRVVEVTPSPTGTVQPGPSASNAAP